MPRTKLFISHISDEGEVAQILKDHLTRDFLKLLDIFVSSDLKTIIAGSNWLDDVSTALRGAQIETILCSRDSIKRPWVNFEAGAGWIRGIRVIPVCHFGLKRDGLPTPYNLLEAN